MKAMNNKDFMKNLLALTDEYTAENGGISADTEEQKKLAVKELKKHYGKVSTKTSKNKDGFDRFIITFGDRKVIMNMKDNKKINIREALNELDKETFNEYDLLNTYDAYTISDRDKVTLAKMLSDGDDAEVIGDFLADRYVIGDFEESLKEAHDDTKVIGGIFEFVEGNQSFHKRIADNIEKILPIDKINEIIVSEDAKTKAYYNGEGGYDKCYVDLVVEKGGKKYRFHGARFDLGDDDTDKTFTQEDLDYVVDLYERNNEWFKPMDESLTETTIPRNAKRISATHPTTGRRVYLVKDGGSWKDEENQYEPHYSTGYVRNLMKDVEIIETDPNYKPKTTKEIKVLQGNYGYGWDDIVEYEQSEYSEIKDDMKDYHENEPQYRHRVVTRRVSVDESIKEAKDTATSREKRRDKISGPYQTIYTLTLKNQYNYTVIQYRIDPKNKTIEKGLFNWGDGKGSFFKNRKELQRHIDDLLAQGYKIIDSKE